MTNLFLLGFQRNTWFALVQLVPQSMLLRKKAGRYMCRGSVLVGEYVQGVLGPTIHLRRGIRGHGFR